MARKSKYLSAQPVSDTSVHYLAGQYGRIKELFKVVLGCLTQTEED